VAFPAGEVAQPEWGSETLPDPPWNPAIGRIAKMAGACTLPIFFKGSNSMAFQLAGNVHPALRTVSLPRELLNKRGQRIAIHIGRPVSKAGGRVLGFNVDRGFSHALDALVMVDLRVAPVSLLERYLGKAEARAFVGHASACPDDLRAG
jgi:putative hemolysin